MPRFESGRVEVTKIDKKSEPAASFEVPPGYKIVTLEEMFKGPGGPPGAAPPSHVRR